MAAAAAALAVGVDLEGDADVSEMWAVVQLIHPVKEPVHMADLGGGDQGEGKVLGGDRPP